jgi:tetratricopeptide (TPR) repeat protein
MHFRPEETTVAILSDNREHAAADRAALLRLRFKSARIFESSREAFSFLYEDEAGLVLVDGAVGDLSGRECIRFLKADKKLRLLPVVAVSRENRMNQVLDAISAGCNGYVIRPYSLAAFERHLKMAWLSCVYEEVEDEQLRLASALLEQGDFIGAAEGLGELVNAENRALAFFDKGTRCLMRKNYGKAIVAFNNAIRENEMFAEAYRGLAYAYKGLGDAERCREHLDKAADIFAFQNRMQELKDVFVEILKEDPDAANPFNTLGVRLRKSGDLAGAFHAYEQALALTPDDANIHYNLSKAWHAAKNPVKALEHAKKCLTLAPDFPEGRELLDFFEKGGASAPAAASAKPGARCGLVIDDEAF